MITLEFIHKVGGTLTDVTSVVLRNPAASFGVRRNDTNAIIVAAGTAMTRQSLGRYTYELTEPAAGLTYTWWAERVYGGLTYWAEFTATGATPATSAYLTRSAADALAASMILVDSYTAATDAKRLAALEMASDRIDAAGPWQGRRYLLTQAREFPRIPYASSTVTRTSPFSSFDSERLTGSYVWDWDSETQTAVVPPIVLKAVIHEAASLLDGSFQKAQDSIAKGLKAESIGSASKSYADAKDAQSPGGFATLCPRARELLARYRLRTGSLV